MKILNRRNDRKVAAYQQELIKAHYAEVESMYKKMRGWRHDYRSHIQTMKVYAQNGDMPAIMQYLDMLDDDLKTVDTVTKTGNTMTDAILNSKITLARYKNIPVKADANISCVLGISELELCSIIGNLFDNAIEASLKLPEDKRQIRVYLEVKETNQLYISFTNLTATPKMQKIMGRYKSSKGTEHGIGLERIDTIVKRLSGYVSRNSEDGAFTTEILIPLEKVNETAL